jgi:hypothetical protein
VTKSVIKANYRLVTGRNRGVVKAKMVDSARYYETRPDRQPEPEQRLEPHPEVEPQHQPEPQYRPAFDRDHDDLARKQVTRDLEHAEGTYAYRLVLSPGEDLRGEHLRDWTRQVMLEIERKHFQPSYLDHSAEYYGHSKQPLEPQLDRTLGRTNEPDHDRTPDRDLQPQLERQPDHQPDRDLKPREPDSGEPRMTWVGYAHEHQTDHPHTHVIAYTHDRINTAQFEHLRQSADKTLEYELDRQLDYEPYLDRDPTLEYRLRHLEPEPDLDRDLDREPRLEPELEGLHQRQKQFEPAPQPEPRQDRDHELEGPGFY